MVNHETNEVFFENFEIPAENLIGEEGKGFRCEELRCEELRLPARALRRTALAVTATALRRTALA
jgi:alkylation response protein AidB-like acyl-CoA dehydrogenase